LSKKNDELTFRKFFCWVVLTPIMLLIRWKRLNTFKKAVAAVWSVVFIFIVIPAMRDFVKDTEDVDTVVQDQGTAKISASRSTDEVWSIEDYIENLRASDVLAGDARFTDKKSGNSIEPAEKFTRMENAMLLQLTVECDGLDPEYVTELAYRIAERIHKQKRDFALANVSISFIDRNGNMYRDSTNFGLGINTISGYFENAQVEKSPRSFFRWIEEHFTLPEDDDFLYENESWTLLSEKSRP
jgi:hypothetical protein